MPRRFFHRHQPSAPPAKWIKAGIGTTIAFLAIWALGEATGATLIVAPFGASAVLVFGVPDSPLSQPANVIGGHGVAALVALLTDHLLPGGPLNLAATVGGVIALLGLLRLTHPPAGATALVVMLTHPHWSFLAAPVLIGAVLLVLVAIATHRVPPRIVYPLPLPAVERPKKPRWADWRGEDTE
ncbi:MAG: HPP family protein [Hyphomicrobiales bacterium]|nr:HPP family protein [Hyphomicrobiales bacterium]